MQLGPRAAAIFSKRYAPTFGIERHRCKARIGRDFFRSKDAPPAANPATPLLSLRWTLSAKRACVAVTDSETRLPELTFIVWLSRPLPSNGYHPVAKVVLVALHRFLPSMIDGSAQQAPRGPAHHGEIGLHLDVAALGFLNEPPDRGLIEHLPDRHRLHGGNDVVEIGAALLGLPPWPSDAAL
jgi:hypothetical protein